MELNEAIQYLMDNKYLINQGGKFSLTKLFQKDAVRADEVTSVAVVKPKSLADLKTKTEWMNAYIQFIELCQVPATGYSKSGSYAMNKYSEDGLKAFRKALEKEKINPQFLILAVRHYYKSDTGYKKAIGNYMASGEWRTDYVKFTNSKDKQQLDEYIKEERRESGGNYRLG